MRILIADDEPIIRMGLSSILKEMGHEPMAAANGREALQLARRQPPDLAILDIRMPYTDGLQAAKTLSRTQPLPILLLTAYSDQELIEKATDLPIHGYLVKPVTPDQLAAAISVAVKRFEDAQDLKQQAAELEDKLETRKLLDRAKGKLVASGLDEEEAYLAIQKEARRSRRSVRQVAEEIIKGKV